MTQEHLSEEQFADLVAGDLPDEPARKHLLACELCRNELQAVRWAVSDLDRLSLDWAKVEAPRRVRTPSRLSLRLGVRPGWGLGWAALTAAGVIAFTLHAPAPVAPAAPAPVTTAQVQPTNTELAQDNRMLESIETELSYRATPTGVQVGAGSPFRHTRSSSKTTAED